MVTVTLSQNLHSPKRYNQINNMFMCAEPQLAKGCLQTIPLHLICWPISTENCDSLTELSSRFISGYLQCKQWSVPTLSLNSWCAQHQRRQLLAASPSFAHFGHMPGHHTAAEGPHDVLPLVKAACDNSMTVCKPMLQQLATWQLWCGR